MGSDLEVGPGGNTEDGNWTRNKREIPTYSIYRQKKTLMFDTTKECAALCWLGELLWDITNNKHVAKMFRTRAYSEHLGGDWDVPNIAADVTSTKHHNL